MVQAMINFTFLILILKINVLKAGNNDILKHSASLTWGEYHIQFIFDDWKSDGMFTAYQQS